MQTNVIFAPLTYIFDFSDFGVHLGPQHVYIKWKICKFWRHPQWPIFDFRPLNKFMGVVKRNIFSNSTKIKQISKRWGPPKSLSVLQENFFGCSVSLSVFPKNVWLQHPWYLFLYRMRKKLNFHFWPIWSNLWFFSPLYEH